ncbi:MAG TPA: succinate--CoA ligase subunit alpha, partial [Arachnia sp.]|nr:succinate--CoA ligase subunit alpha [Arachnia sp.]
MSIFINASSRVLVQGMTGKEGRKHTQRMIMSGTRIVGGVTPGKAGTSVLFEEDPVPVFGAMADAVAATNADVSVVFVPPAHAKAAVLD